MKFKRVEISLEMGVNPDISGIVNIWLWKENAELNEEWISKQPIWEFFEGEQLYMLVMGENIIITENKLRKYFKLIEK